MKTADGSIVRCTLQSCHVYDRGEFRLGPGFACERDGQCPILHPPPPVPIWRRPWFRKAAFTAAGICGVGLLALSLHAIAEARKPHIIALSTTADTAPGSPWEAYVDASGEKPLSYQWYHGFRGDISTPLEHGTQPRYQVPSLTEREILWVRVRNRYGAVDSKHLIVEPRLIVHVDYDRELSELYHEARSLLEQSDSVRVLDTQLNEALVELSPAERERFQNLREMADRKRSEASSAFVAKLKYLQTLDRKLVTQKLDGTENRFSGIEGERRAKALSLMNAQWIAASKGQAVSPEGVLQDAQSYLPL